MRNFLIVIGVVVALLSCRQQSVSRVINTEENNSLDIEELARKFNNPDHRAKPWVFWNWMGGSISREGITADLQAMRDVGIGGVIMFNIGILVPEGDIQYRSKEWLDMVKYAAKTAKEYDIDFTMFNSDGWSTSGGPWVTKENAMKKLVFSEIQIEGGETCNQAFRLPQSNLNYYKDIAILAFPTPAIDIRVPNISGKAGFNRVFDLTIGKEDVPDGAIIKSTEIQDLSAYFSEKGILNWSAPEGQDWTVLRIGYTLTGAMNGPATKNGVGLEIDKLSKEALNEHFKLGIQPIINELGEGFLKGITFDSYEAGSCNWTTKMQEEFKNRREYNLLKWLPSVTGRYINSVKETESFLWDFRKTIADLYEDNYYHHAAKLAKNNNLKFYVEPYEGPFDCLQVGGTASEVLGECWTNGSMIHWNKVASSSAHTNGINLVGSEIFTADAYNGRWQGHPRALKSLGDRVWCEGVNHFVIHRYAHQPWENVKPGQSLGPYGTHFERTNTWWKQSKAWISYITRTQQVLQAGQFVADIALIADEGMPSQGTYSPDIKLKGYDYDLVSAQHVPDFKYINNEFVLPSGARYKAMIFPESEYLTVNTLTKIKELTDAGATIVAQRPISSPSLSDNIGQRKYDMLVNQVFDENKNVVWKKNFDQLVNDLAILPDFEVCDSSINISWIHRALYKNHIYFVSNQMKEPINVKCKFKIKQGYEAEIWKPETGEVLKTAFDYSKDERAALNLNFNPEEAYFIVFKELKNTFDDAYVTINKLGSRGERQVLLMPKLKIESAQLGIFEIKYKNLVDVTQAVRKKVKNNGLSVLSENQLGGDSAPGNYKTLWVEYLKDGKKLNAFAPSNTKLEIAPSEKELVILRAMYGLLPEDLNLIPKYDSIDITNKVKSLVENGRLKFKPIDILIDEMNKDTPRQVKISYFEDGKNSVLIADMNEFVDLPSESWRNFHPFPELICKDGKQSVMVWENGQYELEKGNGNSYEIRFDNIPEEMAIDGYWQVSFHGITGNKESVIFDNLYSYTISEDENIKYFSGTASYSKEITIPEDRFSDNLDIWLDLGRVECIAEVTVNGKKLRTIWKEPYRIKITDFVTPGVNKLKIDVTNLLVNRLIGDEQYPDDYEYQVNGILTKYPVWLDDSAQRPESPRKTFSVVKLWHQDDELIESGLLGPVVLKCSKLVVMK